MSSFRCEPLVSDHTRWQDSSPGDLLGPVMTGSMLCLKFRLNLINMESPSWWPLQSRCDMLTGGSIQQVLGEEEREQG